MKLNGYTFTPKQLSGRWKTLVSSYKLVKDNNQQFGQDTRKILGILEGRSTPNLEDVLQDMHYKLPRGILCTLISNTENQTNCENKY